jgi:predicted RNase H-like nuclease
MHSDVDDVWLAGVDGCRAGWAAAFVRPTGSEGRLTLFARFADLLAAPERPAVIAVDIPIGLPERVGRGGRAAEAAVRPKLGARQSAVFSVPSRAAVYATDYGEACRQALETSDPPRKMSKQLFNIAPKIREVDAVLRAEPLLAEQVYEVHPELAFWRLNGGQPLSEPKKVKSRCHAPGLMQRRRLLADATMPAHLVHAAPMCGARPDDIVDALACAAIARYLQAGLAQPFPPEPPRDAFGLTMAIWA